VLIAKHSSVVYDLKILTDQTVSEVMDTFFT